MTLKIATRRKDAVNTMNRDLYVMLRKAAIKEFRESYIDLIVRKIGFDYRTTVCLIDMIDNERSISKEDIAIFLDKNFYTKENMISMYECGLQEIIPTGFWEDDEFLARCGINRLPDNFCRGNKYLTRFTIKQHIKDIGRSAFEDCCNLVNVGFSWDVYSIGNYAFKNCYSLDIPEMAPNLSSIGTGAFMNCESLTGIRGQKEIRELRNETFMNCTNLEYVDFSGIRIVGDKCFKNCRSLQDVEAVLYEIGKEGFANCTSLRCIEMDGGQIGPRAFMNCSDMGYIKFFHVPSYIGDDAFCGCIFLNAVIVDELYYKIRSFEGKSELFKDVTLIEEDGEKKLSRTITSSIEIKDVLKEVKGRKP